MSSKKKWKVRTSRCIWGTHSNVYKSRPGSFITRPLDIIPAWEVERFSHETTEHLIVRGTSALYKTSLVKGRFVCDPRRCPYTVDTYPKEMLCHIFGAMGCNHTEWGTAGCGVRGYLASQGLVYPDVGETDYTVYNWIHCPDVDQGDTVQAVVDFINK